MFLTANQEYDAADIRVFKRLSAYERGRLSNLPRLLPMNEIRISSEMIVLRKGKREYKYAWSDVKDAFITARKGYKGALFGEDIVRTFHLITKDRKFAFDVSKKFPDFRNSERLLIELRTAIV